MQSTKPSFGLTIGPWRQPEVSHEIGSAHPSILPAFCWNYVTSFFLNSLMLLETHVTLYMTAGFFQKKFCRQNWENSPKMGQKQRFF